MIFDGRERCTMGVAVGGLEKYGHCLILDDGGSKLMCSQEPHCVVISELLHPLLITACANVLTRSTFFVFFVKEN